MRAANRKYAVSRPIVKERMEIFWVVVFRIRLFILLAFGYDPLLQNSDQSPFHHNETGSQNKATLAVRGSIVPVVEGNSDVKSRWTANLTTQSRKHAPEGHAHCAGGWWPMSECMFKAERDGPVVKRLQEFLRSRGFPQWFTVTVGPRGSYREHDVLEFLKKHLEPWREGRDWRIYMLDDYSAHKTENVWNLCWSRGYIRVVHGGGVTPIGQTPDTDMNEHTRRAYGDKEARLLLEKMRSGQTVPKLTHEECMQLMHDVLSDDELHARASEGYKKTGQSIDLHGKEDALVCREAGVLWSEQTTDGWSGMRPKLDYELAAVAEEFESGGLTWCERCVKKLIMPYPARPKVDRIIERLGEDFYHDHIHSLADGVDDAAVAEGDHEEADSSSDDDDGDGEPTDNVPTAVAGGCDDGAQGAGPEDSHMEGATLSAAQATKVHQVQATMAALESTLEGLRAIGSVRGVHCIEQELTKERRKVRLLVRDDPAVAEAFSRLRNAEANERLVSQRADAERSSRKREAAKALHDRDAAATQLRATKRKIKELRLLMR